MNRRREAAPLQRRAILAAVAVALWMGGCQGSPDTQENDRVVSVRAERVERIRLDRTLEAAADVLAENDVVLMPQVGGMIQEVRVREGDAIREGQTLMVIEEVESRNALAQAEASLAAAEAQAVGAEQTFEVARAQHERIRTLREADSISQGSYDEVFARFEQARAAHRSAEAQVEAAAAMLDNARSQLADCRIRAPFDGFVAERWVDAGSVVETMPPTNLMRVVQVDPIRVKARIPELELAQLSRGMFARVLLDALPGEPLDGEVRSIWPVLDPASRNGVVEVALANPTGRIRPGMAARVQITLGQQEVLVVPRSALLRTVSDRRSEVFVLDGEQKVERRAVRLQGFREEHALVIEGLEEDERIVSRGIQAVEDGSTVRIEE